MVRYIAAVSALSRPAWIDAFTMHLSALGVRAEPTQVAELAAELWETAGDDDPRDAAQACLDEWPPHHD